MRRIRSGPSIREFLEYYVLVLLAEDSQTKRQLIEAIKHRSADDRLYRPGGVLWVASAEMANVMSNLQQPGLIELYSANSEWAVTWHGRRARRRTERENQSESDTKERAAEKILSLLADAPSTSYILDVGTGEGFLGLS